MEAPRFRVLIAEDETLICDVIQDQLERIGHTVVGRAADGRQAVDLAESLPVDIVLMDIDMPEMDGLEATRLIQQRSPKPIILLTAHDKPALVRQAGLAGAGAYLVKPPNAREIERTMTLAMDRFNDLMELRRLNAELQQALDKVKLLRGLLPICSSCKSIRDDHGYWHQVERYISNNTDATFTHGLCPQCIAKLYPEFATRLAPKESPSE
jgi:two-component system, response regulator PdtaR